MVESLDVVQDEGGATPVGQLLDRAIERETRQWIRRRGFRCHSIVGIEAVGDPSQSGRAAPDVVEAVIEGEAIQPRPDSCLAPECVDLSKGLKKHFLQQIFAPIPRPGDAGGQGKDPWRVLSIQVLELVGGRRRKRAA